MRRTRGIRSISPLGLLLALVLGGAGPALATDVISNGTFDTNLADWTPGGTGSGAASHDGAVGGNAAGSARLLTTAGRNRSYNGSVEQVISTTIDQNDTVNLSFWWRKYAGVDDAGKLDLYVEIVKPDLSTSEIWGDVNNDPLADSEITGTYPTTDVSSFFDQTGTYTIVLRADMKNGRNTSSYTQGNFDDVLLDVQGAANSAPTVTPGATQASLSPVNRFGTETTTISTTFDDTDDPGVGAFTVTFKTREPDDLTEVILVNAQTNGNGGLTITDNGGGSYTASYDWDPTAGQTLGLYDLFMEVSDGTDNAIDGYANNLNELEVNEVLPNNAPTVTPGATQASLSPVNRFGTETTTISTTFDDTDDPGVGAFTVTFKTREPDDLTEVTLVNAQTNGNGGLTITDNGGGSYTASYDWDPTAGQTLGLYDLFMEVSDGTDNAIDGYANNLNELEVNEVLPNNAPTVTPGATQASLSPVNRFGTETTTISTTFDDTDDPGVGAFTVTFKTREPDDLTEVTLVNAQTNGNGGLTITDNGGGSYTASYDWDPTAGQTLGLYDLFMEVSDGTDNAIDGYANNLNELEVNEVLPNNAPTVTPGATQASLSPVNRFGTETTTISTTFDDTDDPGVGAFTVTFKTREPDDLTEVILVNAQTNGNGGLTITDNGGGSYTASYDWDPTAGQTLGLYDLFMEVSDGTDNAIDGYANNLNELEVNEVLPNNAPTVTPGATQASLSPVNRFGTETTTISTTFDDTDDPGVGAFTVTFKAREPDDLTEVTLVNAQTNGNGGLTITDNGGGSYTASYDWDPTAGQTLGLYDLFMEISDGTDNAIDGYANNLNELEVNEVLPNNAPTVTPGATQASLSPVNRFGTETTTISTTFDDTDDPGVGAFTVTFKTREPDDLTEVILVNAQTNGNGGLTITDNGGGSYTASYDWDPTAGQTLGLYDLFMEISDGTDNAIDGYANNLNELEVNEVIPNNVPVITPGATSTSPTWVLRQGANTTTASMAFSDADDPGVGAFTVTLKVREPDNATEVVLVNAQTNGNGGLTITDDGGGNYTASYVWDPPNNQTLGLYDLYGDVSDGSDSDVDDYANNLDELEVVTSPPNEVPIVAAGATQVSVSPVDRLGANTTTISTVFTDADVPGVGAFTATFKIREPDNATEVILVNAQTNGNGGLTITDGGGGTYTASYTYDPGDTQALGLYDLHFDVSDGTDSAIDGYANNVDELEIDQSNIAPTVAAGATQVSVSPVNRLGANATTVSTVFTDADVPGVGAFTVTFKIREPDDATEVVLVNAQTNGSGGLTITDGGGGSYTASYSYDPLDSQTLGLYDLHFEVSDGTDNAVDDYADNLDELEIDEVVANNAPTVTAAATQVSVSPVNRLGANTTTVSTVFTDADVPGVGAFTVTFKIREPDNATEVVLVNAQTNGSGGLTITDGGGGSYTASYSYDPLDSQTLGLYDLHFEVSDGTDNAVDDYADNLDELEIDEVVANNAPTVTAAATQVSVSPVNRLGANTTTVSTVFTDADVPGVGAFTVTFKIREPDNATEVVLVNAQTNGSGGLTITDGGGGSYTASYSYDPLDSQTLGLYDLHFEVSDGTDNAVDDYADNLDELEIDEVVANNAPTVTAAATQVSVSPVNRLGANTTTVSTVFTDADVPGVGAFTVTFKIREPDNATEVVLVNAQTNGSGGLTITDGGGGSYTASYSYDPLDSQTLGLYDLHFEVSDGTDNAVDGYADNLDELEINEVVANNVPAVTPGATQVSVSTVNRFGANTTTISTVFTDADEPGVGAFTVSFKVREPNNVTELVLVNAQTNGNGGLTITDGGGGSYTASYVYDPLDSQALGFYDLYCEVSDGTDADVDGYASNVNELEIDEVLPNNVPAVTAGATQVSVSPVDRLGTNTTLVSTVFTDSDEPGVGAFTVTFKIREPNNSTEVTLVNAETSGNGGLTILDGGGGSYTARYFYDPSASQTLGLYDLFFEVADGTDNAVDDYADNLDELEIIEVPVNNPPAIVDSATVVFPTSVDRFGPATTEISTPFFDADSPGVAAFQVTFKVREPYNAGQRTLVDAQQNGQGGLTISDDGSGNYTARFDWDPADNLTLGYYDLYCLVSDGSDIDADVFDDNPDELLLTNGGENAPPVVAVDATVASPAGLERVGANVTTLSAIYTDPDQPGVGAFTVTFKVRYPNDSTELVLANDVGNGAGGVTISDGGGGVYTASIGWDPPDAQDTGFYDLYFHVSDGAATSIDDYSNNLDELEIYDTLGNTAPTVTAGATTPQPDTITRLGSEYTILTTVFSDDDIPGSGAFTVTFKVRDTSSSETVIVNAAQDGQQGLRVRHLTGPSYEASVLWDPPVGQVTGAYDLYFEVQDNWSAGATDAYGDNTDELTVTATAILGDGHLLRRTNDAANCTACHNLPDHQSLDCLVCHTPHSTSNLYLIRETIQTPNSGPKPVVFKTLGVGDPFNDPDPVTGDASSGVMADDTDGVFTNVCEACHTTTGHHRNDGSHPPPAHHNAEDCSSCHPHAEAFAVSGGGESSGGSNCSTCHAGIFDPLNSSTTSYHHLVSSDSPDYDVSSETCLMCHVDHDIFRVDLNPGFGARAKNLRADITTTVTQGDASVLSNTDYSSSGTGGICLSCHTSVQTKGYVQPDGTTQTPALPKSDYDAATSAHNYTAPSTFSSDGSTFDANCVKCHNDNRSKSYQNSTDKFSAHDSDYRRILAPLDAPAPADPLEEEFCFQCHSTTSNPNAGSNLDNYGVKAMSDAALGIESSFGLTYTHPTGTFSGRHEPIEGASDLADGATRHAECNDCHNPHAAQQGTHDGSSNLVSNALKGTWGVEPTSWPGRPTPSDNVNLFATPSGYTRVEPAQKEYQICLKCHSNYTTLPSGARNLAEEINPNYASTHGIAQAGTNAYCNTTTMNEPWATSKIAWCSDCHRSSNPLDPAGPHGSNMEHLLVATAVSDNTNGTPLCFVCHSEAVYWTGDSAPSNYPKHPSTQGQHAVAYGCFACHMWEFSERTDLGINSTDALSAGSIYVHGMNKRFVNNEQSGGGSGTGQYSDAFVDGYLENMDFSGRACWTSTCKDHSNKSY